MAEEDAEAHLIVTVGTRARSVFLRIHRCILQVNSRQAQKKRKRKKTEERKRTAWEENKRRERIKRKGKRKTPRECKKEED